MFIAGAHQSTAKGFLGLGKTALGMQANTFQFFLRNPRGAAAKKLDVDDIESLRSFLGEHSFGPIMAHAPYTLNPCSTSKDTRELAVELLADDLERLQYLPGNLYNLHPGSRGEQDPAKAAELTAQCLNAAIKPEHQTVITLEAMSGKGSELGRNFEELKSILDLIDLKPKLGVCFDACHLFCAGYDIANNLDGVLDEFDRIVGLSRLRGFHLNDSMNPLGSHKDRHAPLGEGHIGLAAFKRIVNHPALQDLPLILETPLDEAGHAREVALLREMFEG